ncbi:amidase [Nocardia sp. ET3-3]|uniref:amidase n=1 Tax=Nocardia terrae TaxID=2675851 RepID=A0A7K1USB4_9NOCA|nr:amidase [Nocardia terrae]MVU77242.1 amidase [Nocardia terrae]
MTDLAFTSATELTELIRSRRLSPTELMQHTLDRIDELNGEINAIVSLDHDAAIAAAEICANRIARGDEIGPLAGIPVVVKDLEHAAGFPTSFGTSGFRDAPARTSDSTHVSRLRAAGAIVIGKTNTPPLGSAIHTANDLFGITRNPWDLERSPGGSSGGSAAAVAAGMVPLATASDGGGSTRIPAALCGIIGLKPTRGRIPEGPSTMHGWARHSCATPMARTVRDTALHLDVAAGFHASDPFSLPDPGVSYRALLDEPLRPLRIAVNPTLGVADPEPTLRVALDTAAEILHAAGHDVIHDTSKLPGADDYAEHLRARQHVLAFVRLTRLESEFDQRPGDLEPGFAAQLDQARGTDVAQFAAYWRHRAQLDAWAARVFDTCDLLLTPTTPTTAWPATGPDLATALRTRTLPIAYTSVFNDTGNPAITVPISLSPQGLPVGVQLVGPHHRDGQVLRAAYSIEQNVGQLRPGPTIR